MLSITYVSSATQMLSAQQLSELLAEIRPKNEALGLTGALLYSGGNIMQTLEGDEDPLRRTIAKIVADPRHRNLLVVLDQPIEHRVFPEWSMAFDAYGDRGIAELAEQQRPALASRTGALGDDAAESVLGLLRSFRRTMWPSAAPG